MTLAPPYFYAFLNSTCMCMAYNNIKTHGSELRGQEEAGLCDKRVSYFCERLLQCRFNSAITWTPDK